MSIQEDISFTPIKLIGASERLKRLLKLLLYIENERAYEFSQNGWIDQRKLASLQTQAQSVHRELCRQDLPLLLCISSIEEVLEWTALMPQVLADTRPIPFDDQYRDDPNPIGVDLSIARTWVDTWHNKLSPLVNDKTVFIVHGHDEAKKWELKNLLVKLRLDPIILHEQDSLGMTIIEKFEHYASRCIFAFVLLTPDDIAVRESDTEESKWRARQNVIMELGWFMARLGRRRVIIIHKGQVETPSDIQGVLYLPIKESVDEVTDKIRQRLKTEKILR